MRSILRWFWLAILPAVAFADCPKPLGARKAAIATDHPLASQAGLSALKQGGNAIDAACRAALVLGVVSPSASGIGGGGFMLFYHAKTQTFRAFDFRERAPRAFGEKIGLTREALSQGPLSVGVPGEVAGLSHAVARYGRLPWRRCVESAQRLARAGFPVSSHLAKAIEKAVSTLKAQPALAGTFLRAGIPIAAGQRLRLPQLARALGIVAADSRAFYEGPLAKRIVKAVQDAGGLLSLEDLKTYQVKMRAPVRGSYRGFEIVSMPPPSSGGIAVIEALQILGLFNLTKLGANTAATLHLIAEALTHAFADRARFVGDPDFVKVPVNQLLTRAYAEKLARQVDTDHTRPPASYGSASMDSIGAVEDGGTTHISVVDREGNVVALTSTINGPFGAFFAAGDTGILLNNELDDFSLEPASPNRPAAGKAPLSSMSPTVVMKADRPFIVLGGSGGPLIISATLQALVQMVDFDVDPQTAVCTPRIHAQWPPDSLRVEPEMPAEITADLEKRGHKVEPLLFPSAVQAIVIEASGITSGSDPRKGGRPAGQ